MLILLLFDMMSNTVCILIHIIVHKNLLRHLVKCLLGIFIGVSGVTHRPLILFETILLSQSTEKMLLRIPRHTLVLALDRFGWTI